MKVRIKYLADIEPIGTIEQGDWIDLRSAVDVHLNKGDFIVIPLGVAMELPHGYEAHVAPRSSTFKKWGIIQTNSVGVIDETYCGDSDEWGMPVLAFWETTIHKNDRICQFRIMKKMEEFEPEIVDTLNNVNRGGFGSTGTN